jgi:hypothetical protein
MKEERREIMTQDKVKVKLFVYAKKLYWAERV